LTRDMAFPDGKPIPHPQPPSGLPGNAVGFGIDLRTLVSQVLSDPGFRPPIPVTDIGQHPLRTGFEASTPFRRNVKIPANDANPGVAKK
jgi:hypothetical protein